MPKCKGIGFAFSVKSADFENPHFLPKCKGIGFHYRQNQLFWKIFIFCQKVRL